MPERASLGPECLLDRGLVKVERENCAKEAGTHVGVLGPCAFAGQVRGGGK